MCRLIESIRISDRKHENLHFHVARMNQARATLFGCEAPLELSLDIPPSLNQGVYKCRILYKEKIEHVEYLPYEPKIINSLKLVFCDTINYDYKYENREAIQQLYAQRGNCDDILIVKNGCITDTSYCNIAFFDGTNWVTPSTPLLQGTQRQKLLDEKIIFEEEILVDDLKKFELAKPINALMLFQAPSLPVNQIR